MAMNIADRNGASDQGAISSAFLVALRASCGTEMLAVLLDIPANLAPISSLI